VHYHPRYLERPLKAHGFSVQRPATRAKERDELVIAVWPKRDWVALKKRRSASIARFCSWMRPATACAPGRAQPGRGAGSPRSSSGGASGARCRVSWRSRPTGGSMPVMSAPASRARP
jgi:hypothetical protein